jgi:23S rRNA G2445 N2-methylase RlmL
MPWRKIIGLEISPQLLEKARRNLERMRGRRCRDVQWVNADAAKYELDDDVTTIFLFNPFSGDVLRAVLDNIQESLRRRRRKVTVLYKNRSKLQELGSVPWLRPLGHFACHGTHDFAWYEAVAQGEKANEMSDSMR